MNFNRIYEETCLPLDKACGDIVEKMNKVPEYKKGNFKQSLREIGNIKKNIKDYLSKMKINEDMIERWPETYIDVMRNLELTDREIKNDEKTIRIWSGYDINLDKVSEANDFLRYCMGGKIYTELFGTA